jgi:hypothetical protein
MERAVAQAQPASLVTESHADLQALIDRRVAIVHATLERAFNRHVTPTESNTAPASAVDVARQVG